jgi:transcriptional regulator with XRE-family HTH domain
MTATIAAQPADNTGGWVLRLVRETLGLTQREVAERAGVSAAKLGRMERNEVCIPSIYEFLEVTDALADIAHDRRKSIEAAA